MASRKEWERKVLAVCEGEGMHSLSTETTSKGHLKVLGQVRIMGGRDVGLTVVVGSHKSDGDPRAFDNVKRDIRAVVRAAHSLAEVT